MQNYHGYKIMPSVLNQSSPYTLEYIIKDGSSMTHNGEENFYFLVLNNQNYLNNSGFGNTTEGYLIEGTFTDAGPSFPINKSGMTWRGWRCLASTGGVQSTSHKLSCATELTAPTFMNFTNNTGISYSGSQGGYPIYPQMGTMTWNEDVRVKIAVRNYSVDVYWTPVSSAYDIKRFTMSDSGQFLNNGTLFFGWRIVSGYGGGSENLYIDDLRFWNTTYTTELTGQNFSVLSYPNNQLNNITLIETINDTIANWVAVNMPFITRFSFMTPAGLMNPTTEAICPVRLDNEYNYYDNLETGNPNVMVRVADDASLNKCIRRISYSDYNRYLTTYAGTPLGTMFCLGWGLVGKDYCMFNSPEIIEQNQTTYDVPITHDLIGASAWSDAYRFLDTGGRYYYQTTEFICSSPANLSIYIEYSDKNNCVVPLPNHLAGYLLYNLSVGINPDTNETCDWMANASCYNGSTHFKVDIPAGNGTPIDYCVQYPQLCYGTNETPAQRGGIDDVFSPEQGGGIVGMFSTPAFLGMFASLVVGAGIGWVAGPLLGIGGFIGSIVIATGYGLFPIWIGFVIAVLTAFATAILVKQGILG